MNIFKKASQLRKQHPKKYKDYQDYVSWAKKELHGKGQPKKKAAPKRKRAVGKLRKVNNIAKTVGSVSFHKSQARKQLEEQLAWLLLSRDQAKNKRERVKLSKKVALKRQELQKFK